jgi:hypothetical protein
MSQMCFNVPGGCIGTMWSEKIKLHLIGPFKKSDEIRGRKRGDNSESILLNFSRRLCIHYNRINLSNKITWSASREAPCVCESGVTSHPEELGRKSHCWIDGCRECGLDRAQTLTPFLRSHAGLQWGRNFHIQHVSIRKECSEDASRHSSVPAGNPSLKSLGRCTAFETSFRLTER